MPKDSKLCTIDGCDRVRETALYCQKHNRAFKLYGDPLKLKNHPKGDVCKHPGCDLAPRVKGLCAKHYSRLQRHGSTFETNSDPRDISLKQRIKRSIEKDENGCWIWQKRLTEDGYGQISVGGQKYFSHRIAYQEWVGEIPDGKEVCHTCDVRNCCNPKHLFVGTHKENIQDMHKKGRAASVAGVDNPRATINESVVLNIFFLLSIGLSVGEISKKMGVSGRIVSGISSLTGWRSVFKKLPSEQKKVLLDRLETSGTGGDRNGAAKLKKKQVLAIYDLMANGELDCDIAETFSVPSKLIHRIRIGETWGELFNMLPEKKKLAVQNSNGKQPVKRILSEKKIVRLKGELERGISVAHLARKYGLSETSIRNIRSGRLYADVV